MLNHVEDRLTFFIIDYFGYVYMHLKNTKNYEEGEY